MTTHLRDRIRTGEYSQDDVVAVYEIERGYAGGHAPSCETCQACGLVLGFVKCGDCNGAGVPTPSS